MIDMPMEIHYNISSFENCFLIVLLLILDKPLFLGRFLSESYQAVFIIIYQKRVI